MKLRAREVSVLFSSAVVLLFLGFALFSAFRAPMFRIGVVSVQSADESPPVAATRLVRLAGIRTGIDSLMTLNSAALRTRLLQEPWLQEVAIKKKFPDQLIIHPYWKEPVAVVQLNDGSLSWMSSDGAILGPISRGTGLDLPIVRSADTVEKRRAMAKWVREWEMSRAGHVSRLASIGQSPEGRTRMLASYVLASDPTSSHARRVWIELDAEKNDESAASRLDMVGDTIQRLRSQSIGAFLIEVESAKKTVVRTDFGS